MLRFVDKMKSDWVQKEIMKSIEKNNVLKDLLMQVIERLK